MDTQHEHDKDLDRLALLRRDVPVVFEDIDDGTSLAQLHDAGDLEPAQRLDRTDHAQLLCATPCRLSANSPRGSEVKVTTRTIYRLRLLV